MTLIGPRGLAPYEMYGAITSRPWSAGLRVAVARSTTQLTSAGSTKTLPTSPCIVFSSSIDTTGWSTGAGSSER
jgi:hypothetical protein